MRPLRRLILGRFAAAFGANLEEADRPLEEYTSVLDFFTRRLKPGSRPQAEAMPGAVNSPVDGALVASARVVDGTLLQAKGLPYRLDELLDGDPVAAELAGAHYVTLYLAPKDYHRVHVPLEGVVVSVGRVEGELWPVNDASTKFTPRLYVRNRRATWIARGSGPDEGLVVAAVLVGGDARRRRRDRPALALRPDTAAARPAGRRGPALRAGRRPRDVRARLDGRPPRGRAEGGRVAPLPRPRAGPGRRAPRRLRGVNRGALVLAAGAALAALAAAPARATDAASSVLRWGGDAEGGAPFVEADPADPTKMRGFDVEIVNLVAKKLGRRPEFVQVAFQSLDQSAARGDFDIALSGIEDTPQRRRALAVTVPYFEFREVLTVRAGDSTRYRALADLRGRRVGTLAGTIAWEALAAAEKPDGIVPVSYDDDVHPYEDLAQGRLDAVLLDNVLAARSVRRVPGLAIQPATVATGRYVAILAQENAALRDRIDGILMDAMKNGTLRRIFEEWRVWDESQAAFQERMKREEEEKTKRGISSNGPEPGVSAGALRVGGGPAGGAPPGAEAADAGAAASTSPSSLSKKSSSFLSSSSLSLVLSYLPSLLKASLVTITLSCLAMALAVMLGVVIASGRVYGNAPVRFLLTAYVEITRGTPVLLQLFVLYYGLSSVVRLPAFVAALLGLGLNYAAYESEIYRGALEAVPKGQLEAARTLGLTEGQVLRLVRGPQAFRLALAPMTNDFVALLKDSSLVSVVTVVELTKQTAIFATNIASWAIPGALCAALYLAMSLPLARLARRLEGRWKAASA